IRESYWEIPSQVEYESTDNYEIIETEEGKVVVNENAGLSFMIPEGWGVKMDEENDTVEIFNVNRLENCFFWIGVDYYIENFPGEKNRPFIVSQQTEGKEKIIENMQEIIFIDTFSALKTFKKSGETSLISAEVPFNNRIYNFILFSSLKNNEECINIFDEFLDGVSINI
ncbi:MAG: hypothetical protein WCR84_03095, partial [Candidatus Paceibacterota bacterium]